jgi:hypothetical protein
MFHRKQDLPEEKAPSKKTNALFVVRTLEPNTSDSDTGGPKNTFPNLSTQPGKQVSKEYITYSDLMVPDHEQIHKIED